MSLPVIKSLPDLISQINGKHDIASAAAAGITGTYTYDTSGNILTSKLSGSGTSEYLYSKSTATYDRNGTASVTDTNGNTTSYTYNEHSGLGKAPFHSILWLPYGSWLCKGAAWI